MRTASWIGMAGLAAAWLGGCGGGAEARDAEAGEVSVPDGGRDADDGAPDEASLEAADAADGPGPDAADGDGGDVAEAADDGGDVERTVGPPCDPGAERQTLTFVHVNDLHSNYGPDLTGESPFARVRGYYLSVRGENPYTLFTDGGDDHEKGSIAEQYAAGISTLEATVAMGFDVRVIGNHDFAWSEDELTEFSQDPRALVLLANVEYRGPSPEAWGAVEYGEIVVGCVRVGFFGMVSKPWNERNRQYDGDFYPDLPARYDSVERAREIVLAHRADVDLLVMVSHLGRGDDAEVARAVPGIDVVLGGHSHSVLAVPDREGGAIIVQAGESANYVARLDLEYDLAARAVVGDSYELKVNQRLLLPADGELQRFVEDLLARWAPDAGAAVGWVSGIREAPAIAAATARAAVAVLGADAALVDPETVWVTWILGPLTPQRMLDTFKVERQPSGTPGFNGFYRASISGADLARVRDETGSAWAWEGPAAIDPAATYELALQKHAAFNPEAYLPAGVVLGPPAFALEAWQVLRAWSEARTADCRYVDSDSRLPICP